MSCVVTGRLNGQGATVEDYVALFSDPCERPHKFSSAEVGFVVSVAVGAQSCMWCKHWFRNPLRGKQVCEIMRLPGEQNVPGEGVCRFWNQEARRFPLLHVL